MSERSNSRRIWPSTNEPLRRAVRRLHWFRTAFTSYTQEMEKRIGVECDVDEKKLAAIFIAWLRAVNAQKPSSAKARSAYFDFAASLMLRELIANMPLKARTTPQLVDENSAAAFWPEGYICTLFCLAVHDAVVKQEFNAPLPQRPPIDNIRSWWSFRENSREDSRFAAGFLQRLMGHEPNWAMPDIFTMPADDR